MITEDQQIFCGQVAFRVARVWPDVEAADVCQELIAKWLESAKRETGVTVLSYWSDDDQERGMAKLRRMLTNIANDWCRRETAAIRGNDDYHQYTRYALRQMLPMLHKPEAWGSLAVSGAGGKSNKPAREGGDALAAYADLTRAWDMLGDDQQQLLEWRYVQELVNWQELVMVKFDCTVSAASKRVSRALDSLERALAGRPLRDGPLDRRLVLSNAAAQSRLRQEY